MLGKVRPPTRRANGSPPAGLSEGRLALVERYMIDADEAEARAHAAAERDDAQLDADARAGKARTVSVAEEQARREASERDQMRLEIERRRAAKAGNSARLSESAVDGTGKEMLSRP